MTISYKKKKNFQLPTIYRSLSISLKFPKWTLGRNNFSFTFVDYRKFSIMCYLPFDKQSKSLIKLTEAVCFVFFDKWQVAVQTIKNRIQVDDP